MLGNEKSRGYRTERFGYLQQKENSTLKGEVEHEKNNSHIYICSGACHDSIGF
jgi:hypothetical protein